MSRRAVVPILFLFASCALLLPSCAWDGQLDVLGYNTKPNYDTSIKTVKVNMFKSRVPLTVTPAVGLEQDLTEAVVRELQLKTPYRIAQENADTELTGVIVNYNKSLLNYTQFNTVREAEITLTVELVWRDLRTGKLLTRPARRPGALPVGDPRQALLPDDLDAGRAVGRDSLLPPGSKPLGIPSTPTVPGTPELPVLVPGDNEVAIIAPQGREAAVPVVIRSVAHFRPELGESITTGLKRNIDRMAVQIVSVMEKGW